MSSIIYFLSVTFPLKNAFMGKKIIQHGLKIQIDGLQDQKIKCFFMWNGNHDVGCVGMAKLFNGIAKYLQIMCPMLP